MVNLERCKAQQKIHMGNYDTTDYRGVRELFMRAFGNKRLADKAAAQAAENMADVHMAATRNQRRAG